MPHTLALLDHVATPIFVLAVGDDGVPRYEGFNDAAVRLGGFDNARVKGLDARQIYPGPMGERAFHKHLDVIRTGQQATYEIALPINGSVHQIRTTLDPVLDADGRVVQLIGTSTDLTPLQDAQESKASLHTITTEIESFVAMAAHDLRAPLRNVRMLADMIRDGFEDHGDGKLDLLDMIEDVALQSNLLITDILSYARSVDSEPTQETFELGHLCGTLVATLDPSALHAITWTDARVTTDRTACHIALRNLLDNALKYAARSRVAIHIDATPTSDGMAMFRVDDDGQGFDDPARAFLETGDFKVDSGYGLFGVKRMLTARGGMISAANRPDDQGGRVTFTLPGTVVRATAADAPDARDPLDAPRHLARSVDPPPVAPAPEIAPRHPPQP